ncbi:MAG: hypothetical protein JEY96_14930 [Bacteroidales bacterium]|nr:hypothetical protein [Bacteroidales bacterium]
MTLQKLNSLFKSALVNPLDQSIWNQLDLIFLDLKYKGYTVCSQVKAFNCPYNVVIFNQEKQRFFIKKEIEKTLYLELHKYLQQLLTYKKDVLSKWWKVRKHIRVYDTDYIIVKDKTIIVTLCNNELINLKISALINRRFKHMS